MKIAMIGSKGIPARSGGVERHVEQVATRLAEAGHEVIVYSRRWYTHPQAPYKLQATSYKLRGVTLIPLPSIATKHFDAITHTLLASIDVLRRDVDVVHYHGIGPSLLLWIPKLFSRVVRPSVPLVIIATFHCQDYHHQKWNWFARMMLRIGEWMACTFADETVVVSRELERYVWTAYQRRAVYVPNGVNYELRVTNYELRKALRRWKLKPGGYLLFVGRLVRHKGIHTLITAYRQLQATSYKLQALPPLVIVGAGANTDAYERELRAMAKGLPIHFLGEQTGELLSALLQHARLLIHPSLSEGMSLLLLEAMAAGTPVLASDIPENKEILKAAGTTFSAGNVEHLAKKLRWCLTRQGILLRKARHARAIARSYPWERTVQLLADLYEQRLWIKASLSAQMRAKLAR